MHPVGTWGSIADDVKTQVAARRFQMTGSGRFLRTRHGKSHLRHGEDGTETAATDVAGKSTRPLANTACKIEL